MKYKVTASVEMVDDHVEKKTPGWIGVDLDGTTAKYTEWKSWDHIGDPIPQMIDRIKKWRKAGIEVRVLTARCSKVSLGRNKLQFSQMEKVIQDWTEKHIGERLPVTSEKDCYMMCFFDDSAVQVEMNTGKILGKELPIDIGDDSDYDHEIEELDSGDIANITKWNHTPISTTQQNDFQCGLHKAGFNSSEWLDVRGSQIGISAQTDTNLTRFYLNTFSGSIDAGEAQWFVQLDVYVANGSNRYCFKLDNLSFKSLGKWIGIRVLKK